MPRGGRRLLLPAAQFPLPLPPALTLLFNEPPHQSTTRKRPIPRWVLVPPANRRGRHRSLRARDQAFSHSTCWTTPWSPLWLHEDQGGPEVKGTDSSVGSMSTRGDWASLSPGDVRHGAEFLEASLCPCTRGRGLFPAREGHAGHGRAHEGRPLRRFPVTVPPPGARGSIRGLSAFRPVGCRIAHVSWRR